MLRHYYIWSTPKYGSGFSSYKFTSRSSSKIDYNLIINTVKVEDSAVYHNDSHHNNNQLTAYNHFCFTMITFLSWMIKMVINNTFLSTGLINRTL